MIDGKTTAVAALVLRAGTKSGDLSLLNGWFVKVMMMSSQCDGFLSGEIIPPISSSDPKWALVEWFRSEEKLKTWQQSVERDALKKELQAIFPQGDLTIAEEVTNQVGSRGSVATAIVTRVKPGMEESYRRWETKIKLAQTRFPGYRGAYYQPPMDNNVDQWTTLLRFDSPQNLDSWFASDERRELLAEGIKYIKSSDYQRLPASFPGWFPTSQKSGSPKRWKTAMLVVLSLYPLAVLQMHFVRPLLAPLPQELVTFICNSTSVAIISWLLMPLAVKKFDDWLYPKNEKSNETDIKGLAVLLVLYAIEIIVLMSWLK